MSEELGIIKKVDVGLLQGYSPRMEMEIQLIGSETTLGLGWEEAGALIKKADVYSIKNLVGRGIIVEKENGFYKYKSIR